MFFAKTNSFVLTFLCTLLSFSLSAERIYVAFDAEAGGNGHSWHTAYSNLQTALNVAGINDEIWVKNGTYFPTTDTDRTISFVMANGAKLLGGFDGTEGLRSERDSLNTQTILSGDIGTTGSTADNSHTILTIINAINSTEVSGFILTGGHANVSSNAMTEEKNGAAIYNATTSVNSSSSPTLSFLTFQNNYATESGAAIYSNCNATIDIKNCRFFSNVVTNSGGACFIGATGNAKSATVNMEDNYFFNNSALYGGATYFIGQEANVNVNINSNFFQNNRAVKSGAVGAAIYVFGKDVNSLGNSSVATVRIYNTIFDANSSASSAAGYYSLASDGATTDTEIVNCTFSSNVAPNGAAVYLNESTNSTGFINVYNTIFWQNTGNFNPLFNMSGTGTSTPTIVVRNCLFEVSDCNGLGFHSANETMDCDGSSVFSADPDFEFSNGTNFGLGGYSDAVDRGNAIYLPGFIRDDYINNRREFNVLDIGAYERQSVLPVELMTFTARNEEAYVHINWTTASELNNDYFVVEHSADGRNFEELTTVSGSGTTQEARYYEAKDKNPFVGSNYYRLRQVDFDGTTTYSEIRVVNRDSEKVLVYPNPVKETLYLSMSQFKDGEIDFNVVDMTGRTMINGRAEVNGGIVVIPLDEVQNFQAGAYFISVYSGQRPVITTKFMKIRD